jgi:hypothetical protein
MREGESEAIPGFLHSFCVAIRSNRANRQRRRIRWRKGGSVFAFRRLRRFGLGDRSRRRCRPTSWEAGFRLALATQVADEKGHYSMNNRKFLGPNGDERINTVVA